MRRWGLVIGIWIVCWTTPAFAHLTGAFADFLGIVHDENTIDKLKKEMAETEKEIAELTPRIQEMEDEYRSNQNEAVDKLQFYSETGLDTWLALMTKEDDLVDLLGSQWLIERNVDEYLTELNKLYLAYMQLQSAKDSLEGHRRLLTMIEENLASRGQFLADNEGVELEQLANYLDIDWMSEVEDDLIAQLDKDRQLTDTNAEEWARHLLVGTDYKLGEAWLNKHSKLQYFFRSDHVYVVYKKKDIHVILLGQVLQNSNRDAAELRFEAGFFNGFLLPDTLLEELSGFRIPYQALQSLPGIYSPYLEQSNGELLVRTK
ncbi:hypothetical protein ACIQ4Z_17675 [Peribacillus asahii]|uniref:hypothetical protein n=1 Tax=Peribacillus asahii TaxID=228899 RepID=UPI0038198444